MSTPSPWPPSQPMSRLQSRLRAGEAACIHRVIESFYGEDAVIRSYWPDIDGLVLHVETGRKPGIERYECLGFLMCELSRADISLEISRRGQPVKGPAKLAYRQGEII